MKITIVTGSWARRYLKSDLLEITLPENSTVADALKTLDLPPDETGMVLIGGKAATREQPLSEGDLLKIYPVIIGG